MGWTKSCGALGAALLAAGSAAFVEIDGSAAFVEIDKCNSVPSSKQETTEKSFAACEALCLPPCLQFSFNTKTGHCYLSDSSQFVFKANDHVNSGCVTGNVTGCSQPGPTPPTPPSTWLEVDNCNAVPEGDETTQKSFAACEATCKPPCTQFAFNLGSSHCHTSSDTTFKCKSSDHVDSGCLRGVVSGHAGAAHTATDPRPADACTADAAADSRPTNATADAAAADAASTADAKTMRAQPLRQQHDGAAHERR